MLQDTRFFFSLSQQRDEDALQLINQIDTGAGVLKVDRTTQGVDEKLECRKGSMNSQGKKRGLVNVY